MTNSGSVTQNAVSGYCGSTNRSSGGACWVRQVQVLAESGKCRCVLGQASGGACCVCASNRFEWRFVRVRQCSALLVGQLDSREDRFDWMFLCDMGAREEYAFKRQYVQCSGVHQKRTDGPLIRPLSPLVLVPSFPFTPKLFSPSYPRCD